MKYTIIFIILLVVLAFVFFGCDVQEYCNLRGKYRWPDNECCLQARSAWSDEDTVYQQCIHNKLLKEAIDKRVILPEAERF